VLVRVLNTSLTSTSPFGARVSSLKTSRHSPHDKIAAEITKNSGLAKTTASAASNRCDKHRRGAREVEHVTAILSPGLSIIFVDPKLAGPPVLSWRIYHRDTIAALVLGKVAFL